MEREYENKDILGRLPGEEVFYLHTGDSALGTGSHHQSLTQDEESSFNGLTWLALIFLGLKPTPDFKQKSTLPLACLFQRRSRCSEVPFPEEASSRMGVRTDSIERLLGGLVTLATEFSSVVSHRRSRAKALAY